MFTKKSEISRFSFKILRERPFPATELYVLLAFKFTAATSVIWEGSAMSPSPSLEQDVKKIAQPRAIVNSNLKLLVLMIINFMCYTNRTAYNYFTQPPWPYFIFLFLA
ncbi:hypothetical protein DHC50_01710 [Arenibacter sp. A80]|nr:hypothetical protein [Arenibacter sp. A80]RFT57904.1 hypothetical protein D0S24_01710 [Arenibacter sp. P308M17]